MEKDILQPKWDYCRIPQSPTKPGTELASFIEERQFDTLPSEVVHQAKRLLLEGISWMFLGLRRCEGQRIARFAEQMGRSHPRCTIVDCKTRASLPWAAFANASLCQIHDCNDGYKYPSVLGASVHPGRTILPVALAAVEAAGATGRDLLTAIVIGYDVASRIRGFSPFPPTDAYAIAAVASKAMHLNSERILNAIGLAGYLASSQNRPADYDINFVSNGYLAKTGVEAALLANDGFSGPAIRDEGRFSTRFPHRGMGKEYDIMNVYIKPYPTCRMIHGAIEAALSFGQKLGGNYRKVKSVHVRVSSMGWYVTEPAEPDTHYKVCEFSLPYCMACAFIDGEVGETQFTTQRISLKDVQEFQTKITAISDPNLDCQFPDMGRPTIVEIQDNNGKIFSTKITYEKGEPENPFTDDELQAKFRRWAGPALSRERTERIIEAVFTVDSADNLAPLMSLIRD